ncbi:MAG: glutathione S-transferase N-terminal domain-containing protein, partial [Hydrogenophaga sp.]
MLYSFRRCPYAIRARWALLQSGVSVELREVVLRDKPQALLEASPKGTVPVLVLPGGQVIDESLAIMRWALAQKDPEGWLDRADTGDQTELLAANDGPFKR